jgi:two-component system chemotaxis response regulator CheB
VINPEQPLHEPHTIIRVMLVDDSTVVREIMRKALNEDAFIDVVATAKDGKVAVDTLDPGKVDVIILDIEMPEMDGITALPLLLKKHPEAKIIMASTLTQHNADISLKAMELGALDYVAKPSNASEKNAVDLFFNELKNKILALALPAEVHDKTATVAAPQNQVAPTVDYDSVSKRLQGLVPQKPAVTDIPSQLRYPTHPVRALAIASSTGGPQALLKVFEELSGKLINIPIFITQHMPAAFTTILAQNIAKTVKRNAIEPTNGQTVKTGEIYIAPGDYHMRAEQEGTSIKIQLNQDPPVNFCRPAADPMIESLVNIYGKNLLVLVLTGMGQDGFEGSRKAIAAGGSVVAQDEASSVVWGMPKAVVDHGVASNVLPLNDIADFLVKACGR